ncbi:F-box protein-like protein [Tanacetum coccineum]|uniref:F-box protein-like protein n=1 Tax=Tanacetum coccineum TaxID=301880 RepID=A0ABQ5E9P3_9ASTR
METRTTKSPGLEDIPYLFHHILSLLPVKEAACTCVLSKSWLHAWSTIPKLRFNQSIMLLKQLDDYINLIDRTLLRYFEHNIPVVSFDLKIIIKDQESASLVEKMIEQWIRGLAPKRCFNELCITYTDECWRIIKFTLPDEIFSGVNLTTISVTVEHGYHNAVEMCRNPVINCVSLQVLELLHVNTSEEVLNKLLSTCTLLKKIKLYLNNKLKTTIKVKNLHFLRELEIRSLDKSVILEIDDVPSLCLFTYTTFPRWSNPQPFNMTSLGGVTDLCIGGVTMYDAYFDMINSKFPNLECLTLRTWFTGEKRWDITCVSLNRLDLILWQHTEAHQQIYAPKLLLFGYKGFIIPKLSFPNIVPKQINLKLLLNGPVDHLFFLKMREALSLSSGFDIEISYWSSDIVVPLNIDIDNLRRKVPYPATNVRQLLVEIDFEERMGEYLQFIDTFFSICHPNYERVYRDKPSKDINSYKQMVKWMIEKKMPEVIDVWIKDPHTGKWEDQTNVWRSSPENLVSWYAISFQLNWCSR